MTVAAANILNHQATDADHRTFATGIHNLLIAAGLTQTSDTGQANLATITRPSASAVSGYEIFRFNDTEQATLGCFLKVYYGSSNPNTVPGLQILFGTGSNGVGNLVNSIAPISSPYGWDTNVDTLGQSRPAFVSYAEGQLVLVVGMDAPTNRGIVWYIGRPRAFDGSRTTDGLIWISYSIVNTVVRSRVVYRVGGGGPSVQTTSVLQIVPDSLVGQDDQAGGNIALFPMYVGVNGNLRFGSLFGYRSSAILVDAQQDINVFGGLKTYRTMGPLLVVSTSVSIMVPYF